MSSSTEFYETPEELLFKAPLYAGRLINSDDRNNLLLTEYRLDGYCPDCGQMRTFLHRAPSTINWGWWHSFDHTEEETFFYIQIECTRHEEHKVRFHVQLGSGCIQKIGQYPSFADIAIDESKNYTGLLDEDDRVEFHKAIGLAAHGVGIGSFVYIRRIFERLIQNRFDEYKQAEGWSDQDYKKLRMSERIELLKGHLPDFLVRNSKIYSILSLGIHELNEQDCLGFFDVMKTSTIVILEEDKKKKEELERQANAEKAIAAFEARRKVVEESD